MERKIFRAVLLTILAILLIITNLPFTDNSRSKIFTLPGLPRPIAKEPVVITSAGQSTDTYIIQDIANQLMVRNFFMPQAKAGDIKDMDTLVFVVGCSSLGMKLQDISYREEKNRIVNLLEAAEDKKLTIVTVAIGGEQQNSDETEELLRLIGPHTDYLIGIRESGSKKILTELAKDKDIPLTLVNGVTDILEPFASAFR